MSYTASRSGHVKPISTESPAAPACPSAGSPGSVPYPTAGSGAGGLDFAGMAHALFPVGEAMVLSADRELAAGGRILFEIIELLLHKGGLEKESAKFHAAVAEMRQESKQSRVRHRVGLS